MGNMKTFREIVVEQYDKQETLVDALFEEADVLAAMPFFPSSHLRGNVYEEIEDVNGPAVVNLDSPLPVLEIKTGLKQVDLKLVGGIMEVGEDKAEDFGGPGEYFAKRMAPCLRNGGQAAEKEIIYNSFISYMQSNGRLMSKGGNANANYSIMAIRFGDGENCGLMSPYGFGRAQNGRGLAFNLAPLSGGTVYKDSDGVLKYGQRAKTMLGVQLNMPKHTYGIVNIDPAADKIPTAADIDKMLVEAHARPANTFIFCHPTVATIINNYKRSWQNGNVARTNWEGIPIVTSYNFLAGLEDNIQVA